MDSPDVVNDQATSGAAVGTPETSGVYGETEALDRLQSELPMAKEQPEPGSPFGEVSPVPQGAGMAPAAPGGIPDVLMRPSNNPGTPVFTPLDRGPINPVASAVDDRQRRLALVDQLASSPRASREVREWAVRVRELLVESSVD